MAVVKVRIDPQTRMVMSISEEAILIIARSRLHVKACSLLSASGVWKADSCDRPISCNWTKVNNDRSVEKGHNALKLSIYKLRARWYLNDLNALPSTRGPYRREEYPAWKRKGREKTYTFPASFKIVARPTAFLIPYSNPPFPKDLGRSGTVKYL